MIFPVTRAGAAKGEAAVLKTSEKLGWRRLEAAVYRFSPGEHAWDARPSHRLLMHLSGPAHIASGGGAKREIKEAKSGLIWLFPAGRPNARLEVIDAAVEMLQLLIPAEFTGETRPSDYGIAAESFAFAEREGVSDPVIEAIARSILAELEAPDPAGALYADTVATTLRAYLLRRYAATRQPETPRPADALPKLADPRLERALDHIYENLADELSLEILARAASLSLFHFARAFKAATGVAPHRFVLERRIERARALLRDPELPIATVAKQCGFASQAHLTHVFRRATGATPGAYRAGVSGPAESR